MKKLALIVVAVLAISSGQVQAVTLGDPNVIVNGNIGVNVTPQQLNRPLRVDVLANPTNALAVVNAGKTSECVTLSVDAAGHGFLSVRNSSNTLRALLAASPTQASYVLSRWGVGTNNPQQPLHVVGNSLVTGTSTVAILEITGGSDLAEQFDVSGETVEPGSVVCIDPANAGDLVVSTKPYDRTVAGIISGAGGLQSGMKMGQTGTDADGEHPVALTGRVYVKADASSGAIQPGDLLTTSSLPGHAMKVADYSIAHGAIIGKAMTALDSGTGLVLVLVSLQ